MRKINLVEALRRYCEHLGEILPPEEKTFLQDLSSQYSVSMLMLNIINSCIDMGNEVISLKQLGYPSTYRDVFTNLEHAKIIPISLGRKMRELVGLRNLLAHEYGEVDLELLYEAASDLSFVEPYLEKLLPHLKS